MKNTALAGFILLATTGVSYAQVSGVSVTGGATPSVSSGATSTSTTNSTASSDPTITSSGNTGSSTLSGTVVGRNTARGGQGGRATSNTRSNARGGTGQAVGNQVQVIQEGYTGTGGTGDPSGYVGTQTINSNSTQTLRNVPEIIAPSVNGGANGCAVGVSGGVAVAGFGITTGAGWSDPDCERRQLAALTYNMNDHELAQEILCDSKEVRAARLRMGKPCTADRPPSITVGTADVQRVDPAILRRQQDTLASQQPLSTPQTVILHTRPDWCDTSSPQELKAHRECDQ